MLPNQCWLLQYGSEQEWGSKEGTSLASWLLCSQHKTVSSFRGFHFVSRCVTLFFLQVIVWYVLPEQVLTGLLLFLSNEWAVWVSVSCTRIKPVTSYHFAIRLRQDITLLILRGGIQVLRQNKDKLTSKYSIKIKLWGIYSYYTCRSECQEC